MFSEMDFMKALAYDYLGSSGDALYDMMRLRNEMLSFDLGSSYRPTQRKAEKHIIDVIAFCDVGFGNKLFIRGNTSPLSWHFGKECRNIKSDVWVYRLEFNCPETVEFKVLINDSTWETGYNHSVKTGNTIVIKPQF